MIRRGAISQGLKRALGGAAIAAALPTCGAAADAPFTVAIRETADFLQASSGQRPGETTLNKLQVSATLDGAEIGLPGVTLHGQVFRTNGESLTSRTGDVQTISNIEALSTDRLMEAWAEKTWPTLAVRAGLLDLNADFDSIAPASLFLDSSHGIAPDLSKSGQNGPSIFPVSAAGLRLAWTPSPRWTVMAAAFDGVSGDPDHPKAFAAVRLNASDGALLIGQTDYHLSKDAQVSFGAWTYTAATPGPAGDLSRDHGVYAFVEGPIPHADGWQGWLRAGRAEAKAQAVSGYLGAGVMHKGFWKIRPDDQFGIAFARAEIGGPARRASGLPHAETTWEATYQLQLRNWLAVQPDLQYVRHPSSAAKLPDAFVFGVRLALSAGYPR